MDCCDMLTTACNSRRTGLSLKGEDQLRVGGIAGAEQAFAAASLALGKRPQGDVQPNLRSVPV